MKPLRVLISGLTARNYGGDSYFRSILPVLSRMGDRLECLLVHSDDSYDALCPRDGAVRVLHTDIPLPFRGTARVAWEQLLLPRLARRHGASVIYTACNSGLVTRDLPCVVAIRNMWSLTPVAPGTAASARVRHALQAGFTRLSVRSAARVIAVSGVARDAVLAMGFPEKRIDVIYHGVDDLRRPDLTERPRGGFMAAAAKFIRYANLETMVRAFARLRKLGYPGELRFAGGPHDPVYEGEIRSLVARLGLQDVVRFLGYRPRPEVLSLMRDCDLFLFPSTLEACPFTLLEAMSQGAAIIATTCPPMPEFAADGAALVAPDDDEAFADAAWRLISDEGLRSAQRQRAWERSGTFTWGETAERLLRCWSQASEGHGQAGS